MHTFEPPGLTVPDARPIWCARIHPYVVGVEAGPPHGVEAFDLERFNTVSTLVSNVDGRGHLLLSDGLRAIRIDVLSGTLAGGPAELRYRLAGLAAAERPLLALRRLLALWRTGRFCRSLHPGEARAKRWLLMLRAHDALTAGADQRQIAEVLLSADTAEPLANPQSQHSQPGAAARLRSPAHGLGRLCRATAVNGPVADRPFRGNAGAESPSLPDAGQ